MHILIMQAKVQAEASVNLCRMRGLSPAQTFRKLDDLITKQMVRSYQMRTSNECCALLSAAATSPQVANYLRHCYDLK